MSEAELLLRDASSYLKLEDLRQLQSAYEFSEAAHDGQYRRSGEPYISHPVAVATILAQWHLDSQALTAALLHDVMEDTTVTKSEISEKFGKMVAELVDGVSKLDKIEFESQEQAQAENFRKMFLAMARDVRVILIKLADRLHNMRTLDVMHPKKRARIARETLEIYAPIANRLGLNGLYQELQELSFMNLYPNRYRVLKKALETQRGNRKEVVEKILDAIKQRLEDAGIDAQVNGREKNLYSIYRKMQDKNLSFSKVLDIYGFRVIVKDVPCLLRGARRAARAVQADPGQVQGLHRHPQGQRLSVPAHHAVRSLRQPDRDPDPHRGDAQDRRGRRGLALAVQEHRRVAERAAAQDPPVAAEPAGDAVGERGFGRSFSSTSRSTCSPTRLTSSRPRARSWPCRMAPPAWTSPTPCTPTSATAAWRPRSTTSWCRCAPS